MEQLFLFHRQVLTVSNFLFRRSLIDKVYWPDRLIGITGARGVGKTTLLFQHIKENYSIDSQKCLYVTLDSPAFSHRTLFDLADEFSKSGGEFLIIDEIHKYPHWAAELKSIYDQIPALRIAFSGSSALNIYAQGSDLSRRAVFYHLGGLSFREYLEIELKQTFPVLSLDDIARNHRKISIELVTKFKPLEHFASYLKWGYYPFYLQGLPTYHLKLQGTINYVIENEIPALAHVNQQNILKIKRFLQLISVSVPFQPNINKLAGALDINRNTLLNYLNYLAQTSITINLFEEGNFYGVLTKPQKILLHHPNIAYCINPNQLNEGSIRESFFANQLGSAHQVTLANKADFVIDGRYTFEIGGKGKSKKQIAGKDDAFVVSDKIETSMDDKIPLWLFGFVY